MLNELQENGDGVRVCAQALMHAQWGEGHIPPHALQHGNSCDAGHHNGNRQPGGFVFVFVPCPTFKVNSLIGSLCGLLDVENNDVSVHV